MTVEAQVAARWWANALRRKLPESPELDQFEVVLREWVEARLATGKPAFLATTDCGPRANLAERADEAGLMAGALVWPYLTSMFVYQGRIDLMENYNKGVQQLPLDETTSGVGWPD
jgi:hypothetical protein